jgi:hypothetical protein
MTGGPAATGEAGPCCLLALRLPGLRQRFPEHANGFLQVVVESLLSSLVEPLSLTCGEPDPLDAFALCAPDCSA